MASSSVEDILNSLSASHRVNTQFDVAASTLLLWDTLLTLGKEIDLVWRADWNFIKALYLFQRYLPIVDTMFLTFRYQLSGTIREADCVRTIRASAWISLFGFALSEVILTLRAWAVWNRDRRLTFVLLILWVTVWGLIVGFEATFAQSIKVGPRPYTAFRGCFLVGANTALFQCFLLLTIWNIVVFGLIAVKGISTKAWTSKSKLFHLIYIDGAIYYLYVFMFSLFNIVALVTFRSGYQFTLLPIERCIHSLLASRVLLNLRLYARENSNWSDGLTDFVSSELPQEQVYYDPRSGE